MVVSIRRRLRDLLAEALASAQARGLLPDLPASDLIQVERPQNPQHGDYASNLALRLARTGRTKPMPIAEAVAASLPAASEIERVDVAAPGFINFTLSQQWLQSQIAAIEEAGEGYGCLDLGGGAAVQVEFVSANPTGPLHVGNGRGAVLGSALANILEAAGYRVQREYYVNDAGLQTDLFARTLYARYLQALGRPTELPPEGYAGHYMVDLAQQIAAEEAGANPPSPPLARGGIGGASLHALPEAEALARIGRLGMDRVLAGIREDLERLGVRFDRWFNESTLFQGGQYERAMGILAQQGYLEEREGARWFVSTALGDSKDNVVVRSNGQPTYFASDIAYHYHKFAELGFQRVINVWGADHQGHVSRMKAVIEALGFDPEQLTVIIAQMVSLRRGAEVVKLSKRSGDIITLREVLDEVGADACRYFFISRSADSQMDFDLELAQRQAPENPVYYIQYAHARIASILRRAAEQDRPAAGATQARPGDVSLIRSEPELALLRQMVLLPEVVELAAQRLEPQHLAHYALALATAFHHFYEQTRVVSEDTALSAARLRLVQTAQLVLARVLTLMGMTVPERM